jgi:hypothetical protein
MTKYKFLAPILLLSMTLSTFTFASEKELSVTKSLLSIKVAGYDFKRLEGLFDGRVKIKGCDATFQKVGIGDMNTDAFS